MDNSARESELPFVRRAAQSGPHPQRSAGRKTSTAFFKLHFNATVRVDWEFAAPLPYAYTPPTRTTTFDDDNRLLTVNGVTVTNDLDGNLTYGPLINSTFLAHFFNARNQLLSAGNRTSITNKVIHRSWPVMPSKRLAIRVRSSSTCLSYSVAELVSKDAITGRIRACNVAI